MTKCPTIIFNRVRYVLICLFLIVFVSEFAIASNSIKDSVLEKENEAKRLGQQWNGAAMRRSIALYAEAADEWTKLGERQKTTACLREAALLLMIASDYEKASANLRRALRIDGKNGFLEGKIINRL